MGDGDRGAADPSLTSAGQRGHERIWGFIDQVAKSGAEIGATLEEQHYATKTRGPRTLPAARPAGEGAYALVQIGRNLHLTYELGTPEQPGRCSGNSTFPYRAASSSRSRTPTRGRLRARACRPRRRRGIRSRFSASSQTAVSLSSDLRLLDYEGAEFVLIGARTDPEQAYGIDIEAEHETLRKADLFRQLKLSARTTRWSRC